jgi:HEAT repeat protein
MLACLPAVLGCCLLGGGILHAVETAPSAAASVPALIASLKSADEKTKIGAINQLGAEGEQAAAAVAPLTELLKDPSPKVRAHAVRALGAIGSPAKPAVAALAELLKDPDESVRRQIVSAIRAIHPGPQVTIPLCVKLLEDSDPGVRVRILNTIAEAGTEAVPGLTVALKNEKAAYWACIILRSIGPSAKDAVPALAETIKNPQPQIRREAILALGAMGEGAASAVPQIVPALSDEATSIAATFALGQIGQMPPAAEAIVMKNAKSNDPLLSTVSIWAIARIHPADKNLTAHALAHLIGRLKHENSYVRELAAQALLALPPAPDVAPALWEKAFESMDETTARHALDALASLGAPAVPRLINALKYEGLRGGVADVLGHIGPPAAPATMALAGLLADKSPEIVHQATLALANIGPGAKEAVPDLIKSLQEGADTTSAATDAAYALGRIGPQAAAAEPALSKLLKNSDQTLALVSAWALTQIRPASADVAAKTLPVLIAGLSSPQPISRQSAAEALANLGPLAKSAVPALQKAAADKDKNVSATAAKALAAIGR